MTRLLTPLAANLRWDRAFAQALLDQQMATMQSTSAARRTSMPCRSSLQTPKLVTISAGCWRKYLKNEISAAQQNAQASPAPKAPLSQTPFTAVPCPDSINMTKRFEKTAEQKRVQDRMESYQARVNMSAGRRGTSKRSPGLPELLHFQQLSAEKYRGRRHGEGRRAASNFK